MGQYGPQWDNYLIHNLAEPVGKLTGTAKEDIRNVAKNATDFLDVDRVTITEDVKIGPKPRQGIRRGRYAVYLTQPNLT